MWKTQIDYVVLLIVLIVYWFLIAVGMSFLVQDEFIASSGIGVNTTYTVLETKDINFSSIDAPTENTISKWKTSIGFLFGNKLSTTLDMPPILNFLIGFMNWISVILIAICIYKIGNPISSA